MDDTGLVNLEVDLTGLDVLDGAGDIHGDGTGLRVRHEAARTEDTADRADLTHHGRGADDDIDIGPATLDLLDIIVETDIVGTGFLRFVLLVRGAEDEDADDLTGSVRKGHNATDHLVGLARVDTEVDVEFDGGIEFGEGDVLEDTTCLRNLIKLGRFVLRDDSLLVFRKFCHDACRF